MNKNDILDLCRKSGFSACRKGEALSIAVRHGIDSQICTLEVLNLVKLVEQATLERAAKVCEDADNVEAACGQTYYAQLGDASATRYAVAEEIRALKDSND